MKITRKKALALMLMVSFVFVSMGAGIIADGPTTFNAVGGTDLVAYSQNAGRINFDTPLFDPGIGQNILHVQALKSGDDNYNEDVVNGVKNGLILDGKSVAEWNVSSDYGVMVHFWNTDEGPYITVYADPSLVDFTAGEKHTLEFTDAFVNYSGQRINPVVFEYHVASKTWTKKINVDEVKPTSAASFPEHPDWGNFMLVYFDSPICVPPEGSELITFVEQMDPSNPLYNEEAVQSVLHRILVNGKTIAEWISTGVTNAAQIHMAASDIRIYMDSSLVLFNDKDAVVEIAEGFKTFTGKQVLESTKFYYSSQTKSWSTTPLLPEIEVDNGMCYPEHPEWGNFMEIQFKEDICPDEILTGGLITNVHAMNEESEHYNADTVSSVLNKLAIDGKTVSEWLASDPQAVQVHMAKNGIRVYMDASKVAFTDGNTHTVEIRSGFITFTNKMVKNTVALHYDPANNTWGTEVVTPAAPPPGDPAEIFTVTDLLVTSSGFGNVYFYLTNIINRIPSGTINVQAGGGNIPEDVQNAVLDKIIIDGKSVRQWNEENNNNYSVMIAYETEGTPQGVFGRLSIWSHVEESTLAFSPDRDHTVEFLEGLIGLNYAPILPSKWKYSAADMMWERVVEDKTQAPDVTPADTSGADTPGPEENPKTSDASLIPLFILLVISATAIFLAVKRRKKLAN